jgi:hypothetical protein
VPAPSSLKKERRSVGFITPSEYRNNVNNKE